MPSDAFSHRFGVALHDIDAAGVLFFAHLFRHAHDAYEAFMESIGFPLDVILRERHWLLPLVHAEADYRAAIRHGEIIQIELAVAKIGHSSFTLDYRFLDPRRGLRATVRTVHVATAPDRAGSLPLSAELRAALGGAGGVRRV